MDPMRFSLRRGWREAVEGDGEPGEGGVDFAGLFAEEEQAAEEPPAEEAPEEQGAEEGGEAPAEEAQGEEEAKGEDEAPPPPAEEEQAREEGAEAPSEDSLQEPDRAAVVEELAKRYALGEEEAVALDQHLPRLMAELHVGVVEEVMRRVGELLPQVVPQVVEATSAAKAAEQRFYERWPKLRGHEATVEKVAKVYREVNPDAPVDRAIEEIGLQAMVMLKLPLEEVKDDSEAPAAPPPPPPAGRSSAPAAPPPEPTVWDELVSEEE